MITNARASPASDARDGVTGLHPVNKYAKTKKIRLASLNVGTLKGKMTELGAMLEQRKIDIMCVQETNFRGKKATQLGNGFKLYYMGQEPHINGVGIILAPPLIPTVIEVSRISDRIIAVKMVIEKQITNVISVYAPQCNCPPSEKELFRDMLDQVVSVIPPNELVLIGGDFNSHIGTERNGFERIHGGHGYGALNEDGEHTLQFAQAYDLAIANSFFQKRESHLITYQSGGHRFQIDFMLVSRRHLRNVTDCKVIPGQTIAAQHQLLILTSISKKNRQKKGIT